ncbi:alpha/beta fold hydrolase [Streptosporangium sp. G11]|uniref:alpha/beta fold hydrolase n=1 Tax=Streptosporangium sp. G11 TaxID=3436926 RepID=UPI003EBBE862
MIIQGERDAFVPLEDGGSRVARAVVSSSLVTIPGALLTHFEQWNELMLEFLAR